MCDCDCKTLLCCTSIVTFGSFILFIIVGLPILALVFGLTYGFESAIAPLGTWIIVVIGPILCASICGLLYVMYQSICKLYMCIISLSSEVECDSEVEMLSV